MIRPSREKFLDLAVNGRIPPLYVEIPYISPFLLYEVLSTPGSFLLESVKGPEKIARYSFVGFEPCLTLRIKDAVIELESFGKKQSIYSAKPLQLLKGLVEGYKQLPHDFLPPFQGGMVGVFGYDFACYLEHLPRNAKDDLNLPEAHFMMIDRFVACDHFERKTWIIACPGVRDFIEGRNHRRLSEKYDEAEEALVSIRRRLLGCRSLGGPIHPASVPKVSRAGGIDIVYEMKKNEYMEIVKKAKEYIAAGDIFQANLSQRVSARIDQRDPWGLYGILRSINPAPFAAYMDFGDYGIISSSPERLVKVSRGKVDTRPIAGTRPRGRDNDEDEIMRAELLLNEKERAEHIMLIDLERNDIGRVCNYGTIAVDELMITEDCSHVIHIVSNVTGNLAKGKDCFDAVKAVFPGGTITGVPKVRCMEIIDELEPLRRGFYTGSIGYVGFSGSMDLNIIIRTFVIKSGVAYVQAGAGIVADSDPEREYFETLKKAEALIKTLEAV